MVRRCDCECEWLLVFQSIWPWNKLATRPECDPAFAPAVLVWVTPATTIHHDPEYRRSSNSESISFNFLHCIPVLCQSSISLILFFQMSNFFGLSQSISHTLMYHYSFSVTLSIWTEVYEHIVNIYYKPNRSTKKYELVSRLFLILSKIIYYIHKHVNK